MGFWVESLDNPLAVQMNVCGINWGAVSRLLALGVPAGFAGQLTGAGDLALGAVEIERGGRFAFGGPDRRLLLAVRAADGTLVDVAAISSACEDEWALHLGAADFLGEHLLHRAGLGLLRELHLFARPLDWLRAGGAGICVLDWTSSALGALRGLGSDVTLMVEHGARGKLAALLAHGGLPLVAEKPRRMGKAA